MFRIGGTICLYSARWMSRPKSPLRRGARAGNLTVIFKPVRAIVKTHVGKRSWKITILSVLARHKFRFNSEHAEAQCMLQGCVILAWGSLPRLRWFLQERVKAAKLASIVSAETRDRFLPFVGHQCGVVPVQCSLRAVASNRDLPGYRGRSYRRRERRGNSFSGDSGPSSQKRPGLDLAQ